MLYISMLHPGIQHITRIYININVANLTTCSPINTWIDYCNTILYKSQIKTCIVCNASRMLQQEQYAMLSTGQPLRTYIKSLYVLLVKETIDFQIATTTQKIWLMDQLSCLSDYITDYVPSHMLRSTGTDLLIKPETNTSRTNILSRHLVF